MNLSESRCVRPVINNLKLISKRILSYSDDDEADAEADAETDGEADS